MERRAMLKGLLVSMPVAAGAAAAASAAYMKDSASFVKDKTQETYAALEKRVDELKSQFDESDKRNKKLIKLALAAAALSLGIDLGALL